MIPLTRSRQDYLKALYALSPGGEPVATSRLARRLNVSAPSVTNMLARLASERLVDYAPRAGASLTSRGRREAMPKPVSQTWSVAELTSTLAGLMSL